MLLLKQLTYYPVLFSKFASATRQRNIPICSADTCIESFYLFIHTGCVDFTIKMMFFVAVYLLITFLFH